MSKSKNEIPALIAALAVTAALIAGAFWWIKDRDILNARNNPGIQPPESPTDSNDTGNPAIDTNSVALAFASVPDIPSGQFSYGGSTTWAPLRGMVDPVIQAAVPDFSLVFKTASGSSQGIQMLIDGELDFAQSSRPLTSAERRRSQQKGLTLEEVPVMLEGVAVATHPDMAIAGLTLAQLKDIYTGYLTNWSQVGGPNLAIVPASRDDSGGTVQFFQEDVLDEHSFVPSTQILNSTTEALRFVSSTPGAIYFASAPEIVGQCTVAPVPIGLSVRRLVAPYQQPFVPPEDCPTRRNQINAEAFQSQDYPLIRPLYVIIRSDNQPAAQAGRAYAEMLKTQEGESLIRQVGFVPLP